MKEGIVSATQTIAHEVHSINEKFQISARLKDTGKAVVNRLDKFNKDNHIVDTVRSVMGTIATKAKNVVGKISTDLTGTQQSPKEAQTTTQTSSAAALPPPTRAASLHILPPPNAPHLRGTCPSGSASSSAEATDSSQSRPSTSNAAAALPSDSPHHPVLQTETSDVGASETFADIPIVTPPLPDTSLVTHALSAGSTTAASEGGEDEGREGEKRDERNEGEEANGTP